MNTEQILEEIDREIARLVEARALLSGAPVKAKPGPKPKVATSFTYGSNKAPQKRGKISPEGRARIAAAQKARWAKVKNHDLSPKPPHSGDFSSFYFSSF
jgi:hypothetical protein